jgi:hypothetical protein
MFFCYYWVKHTMFLVLALDLALIPALIPVPDPTLIPALSIAQKCKVSWRLWHWRPVMDKTGTWTFFMIGPSSYKALDNSVSVVQRRQLLACFVLLVRASFIVFCQN